MLLPIDEEYVKESKWVQERIELHDALRDAELKFEIEQKICEELRQKIKDQNETIRQLECDLVVATNMIEYRNRDIDYYKKDRDFWFKMCSDLRSSLEDINETD